MGVIPILKKNFNPFALFPFINNPSEMEIFIYSTYPFLLQPSLLLTEPTFNQSNFIWKSKVNNAAVDITCFFQDVKSSLI